MSLKKFAKQKFGYDITELAEHVDETSQELLTRSVTTGSTLSDIIIDTEVRGKKKLKIVTDSISYQAADDCKMTPDGDTTKFTDRILETTKIGWEKEFCAEDLIGYWPQMQLRHGANAENEDIPFQEVLMNYLMEIDSLELERLLWRGNKALGGNLQWFDGFATMWKASNNVINANSAGTAAITVSNAYAEFLKVARAIPESILSNESAFTQVVINCNRIEFNLLRDNIYNSNNFHVAVDASNPSEMMLPATGVMVKVRPGVPAGELYASRKDRMFFGTDLQNNLSEIKVWYSQDDDKVKARKKFYAGVQYPFSQEVVKWVPFGS